MISTQVLIILSSILEILIMAGGFGKRLMPITKKIPKPLIKIKKKTLLEIIINNFKKYGFHEFKFQLITSQI